MSVIIPQIHRRSFLYYPVEVAAPHDDLQLFLSLIEQREFVKYQSDGKHHEQYSRQYACRGGQFSHDGAGNHVTVSHGGHADRSPPPAGRDGAQSLVVLLLHGVGHDGEEGHSDGQIEQQQADLLEAVPERGSERAQACGVTRELQDAEDPHQPQHLSHAPQVSQRRAALHHQVHQQGQVKGQDGHQVDQIQRVFKEAQEVRRHGESGQQLEREPADAEVLHYLEAWILARLSFIIQQRELAHAVHAHGGDGAQHHQNGEDADDPAEDRVAGIVQHQPDPPPHASQRLRVKSPGVAVEVQDLVEGGGAAGPRVALLGLGLRPAAVIGAAAARVQEQLVDAPVLHLLTEGEDAELVHHVEPPRVVEV